MSGEGTRARERFFAAMQAIEVGAKVARRSTWTITRHTRFDCGVELTLKNGRRTVAVHVPICHSGPILWEAGLRPVAAAPSQRQLGFAGGAA